jgi:hypothetical protein
MVMLLMQEVCKLLYNSVNDISTKVTPEQKSQFLAAVSKYVAKDMVILILSLVLYNVM